MKQLLSSCNLQTVTVDTMLLYIHLCRHELELELQKFSTQIQKHTAGPAGVVFSYSGPGLVHPHTQQHQLLCRDASASIPTASVATSNISTMSDVGLSLLSTNTNNSGNVIGCSTRDCASSTGSTATSSNITPRHPVGSSGNSASSSGTSSSTSLLLSSLASGSLKKFRSLRTLLPVGSNKARSSGSGSLDDACMPTAAVLSALAAAAADGGQLLAFLDTSACDLPDSKSCSSAGAGRPYSSGGTCLPPECMRNVAASLVQDATAGPGASRCSPGRGAAARMICFVHSNGLVRRSDGPLTQCLLQVGGMASVTLHRLFP
jgi:hypothetical protein